MRKDLEELLTPGTGRTCHPRDGKAAGDFITEDGRLVYRFFLNDGSLCEIVSERKFELSLKEV